PPPLVPVQAEVPLPTAVSASISVSASNLVYLQIEPMDIVLPDAVRALFNNVTDSIIRCANDKHNHIYRLVIIKIRGEIFYLLTNRFNLSTFQIIMLYAYRWQIELFFRFLKRTIGGIHLVKNTQEGVTIQFYILLVCALLELKLKQDTYQNTGTEKIKNSTTDLGSDADTTQIKESEISNTDQFLEFIGNGLKKCWKISIHWLSALRILMHEVFDSRVIEILGAL
ncbi:MAG: transposase, partial [Magnetococcus sp. XQGC-1]